MAPIFVFRKRFTLQYTLILLLSGLASLSVMAETFTVSSPDGALDVTVVTDNQLQWSVTHRGKKVITPSELGMVVDGKPITRKLAITEHRTHEVDQVVIPAVAQKSSRIRDHYHDLHLVFNNQFGIEFRAYNDGVAYRFFSQREGDMQIDSELMELNFPKGATTLFPEEETLISHFERHYIPETIADINKKRFASLPAYMAVDDINVVFTESDVWDYPGMFLYGTGKSGFRADFPGVVTRATPMRGSEDRNQNLTFAKHIAETRGTRSFPWRLAIITADDRKIIESELVYLLARDNQIGDTSWIKPGKVAWDWYNANNIYGVDFKSGLNTETYKYYIDFASRYGLEYVILDEGWSKSTTNILAPNPDLDVKALIAYGREKNVRIILWTLWGPLDKDYENILATWASWGVAGIKVDFMQRADQYMVNFYEKIAREAARHKLLVDYHGGFKPSGHGRTYPNVLSHEGVKGNENNKWSRDVTPKHTVTLPFIRMAAGPMDFTPGALRNARIENHNINHYRPMSIGTRAHQVAMYAVFESPLQMLCESPSSYYREPKTTEFIARFPTTWDETRVLHASVGEYVVIARRHGDNWYIGAMTDEQPREFTIDFSFLGEGNYQLDLYRDGVNTENFAEDYQREQRGVTQQEKLKIKLASGGGWAGIISRK